MTEDPRPHKGPEKDEFKIPRLSFFELIPRKTFFRVAVLLCILVAILYLRRRSGNIAQNIAETLMPPPPGVTAPAPGAERAPPTVRMAAPPTTLAPPAPAEGAPAKSRL